MKKIAAVLATAALMSGLAVAPAVQAKEKLTGEAKLAKMLEGREAGTPVDCIQLNQVHNTRVVDKTAIVYEVGSTLYVNRPSNADQLDDDQIMVTKLHTSQLCQIDTVQIHDRSMPSMWRGFVGLNEFIPYKRIKVAKAD